MKLLIVNKLVLQRIMALYYLPNIFRHHLLK